MNGYIISCIVSIITSLVAWFLSIILFKPRMGISKNIVTAENNAQKGENKNFNFKIQNQSWIRDVYDISVYATYCFASKNYYSTKIRHLPRLKVKPFFKTVSDKGPYEMKIEIHGPQTKINSQQSLEDFFNNISKSGNDKPYIDIEIVAYDQFGSVKYAFSQRYYKEDIMYEHYFRNGSLVPEPVYSHKSGYAVSHGNNN